MTDEATDPCVWLSEETGMTMTDRNNRTSHRVAVSRVGVMDGAKGVRHLGADIGMGAWRNSRWNNTWMALAKCRDMDPSVFFPSDTGGERAAQRICAVCPVKMSCLEYSLENRMDDGVWGGSSERERRFLLHQR
jgi:WhiB family transcriptional regulator, redox-sensing transcriptional regulator